MVGETDPVSKDLFGINDPVIFKRTTKERHIEKKRRFHSQLAVLSVYEFLLILQSP